MSPRKTRAAARAETIHVDDSWAAAEVTLSDSTPDKRLLRKPLGEVAGNTEQSIEVVNDDLNMAIKGKGKAGRRGVRKGLNMKEDGEADGSRVAIVEQENEGDMEDAAEVVTSMPEVVAIDEDTEEGVEEETREAINKKIDDKEAIPGKLEPEKYSEEVLDAYNREDTDNRVGDEDVTPGTMVNIIDGVIPAEESDEGDPSIENATSTSPTLRTNEAIEAVFEVTNGTKDAIGNNKDIANVKEVEHPSGVEQPVLAQEESAADSKLPIDENEIFSNYDGVVDIPSKLVVVKERPSPTDENYLPELPAHEPEPNPPEAVQKLEALFEPESCSDEHTQEESSIAEILARTPLVRTPVRTHPENPIEAMDALDEALEAIGKEIPAIDEATTRGVAKEDRGRQLRGLHVARKSLVARSNRPSLLKGTTTTRKSSVEASAKVSSQRLTLTPAKADPTSKIKQRSAIAALNTPPALVKSIKPLTKSSFQLPGEAIAAKLKAQREERLQKEADESQQKREFKARPIAIASKPAEVKTTAASRARLSMSVGAGADGSVREGDKDVARGTLRRTSAISSRPSIMGSSRTSTLASMPRARVPSSSNRSKLAGVDGTDEKLAVADSKHPKVAPKPTAATARPPTSSNSSAPTAKQLVIPANSVLEQRQKGKEIFNRDKVEKEEREKAVREKAEAAKKARAEAAERGRVASREWAQKRRVGGKAAGAGSRAVSRSEGGGLSGVVGDGKETVEGQPDRTEVVL